MKVWKFVILLIVVACMNLSCTAQSNQNEDSTEVYTSSEIEVLYFHYTRRCATCLAVEDVSRETVTELYSDMISFMDYNLDEPVGKQKGQVLGVSGQMLLIVSGDSKIDITGDGFLYARSDPDKLKQIIAKNIKSLL